MGRTGRLTSETGGDARRRLAVWLLLAGAASVCPAPAIAQQAQGSGSPAALPHAQDPAPGEELLPPQPPTLFIRGFADVNYELLEADTSERGVSNGFALGEFDLFMTSQIAPDLQVLGELVFHFEEERDAEFFEVERLLLQYRPSDAFGLRLGRVHTSIGHWNDRFHHGAWFQASTERPHIVRFEDEGGVLPVHSVGVEVFGLKTLGDVDLQYSAGLFNGRGRTLPAIQAAGDENDSKALSAQLELLPARIRGLRFGFSVYADAFPADPNRPERQGEMDERILAGHLVYRAGGAELLAELVHVRHQEPASGRRFDSRGAYAQLSYSHGNWKPYARVDTLDLDEADPLFEEGHRDVDGLTVGLRWDPSAWLALKLEYRSTREGASQRSDAATLQAAFTF